MDTTAVELIVAKISAQMPVRSGSLRIWGEWFGRPYDNVHSVIAAHLEGCALRLDFSEGEVLLVWQPNDVVADERAFKIIAAGRVRWTWYDYGLPRIEENRYYIDYEHTAGAIIVSSNANWVVNGQRPFTDSPAVELL